MYVMHFGCIRDSEPYCTLKVSRNIDSNCISLKIWLSIGRVSAVPMARLGQCIDDGNCGKRYQRERLARDYLENPSR